MPEIRTYLDYNASAPMRQNAKNAMANAISKYGNPSSVHTEGRSLRAIIENARVQVAKLVNAKPQNVIFTSGATEAANIALTPNIKVDTKSNNPDKLIVSATEHHAIIKGGRFNPKNILVAPVNENGIVMLDTLKELVQGVERPFVAVQKVNGETGVIQPVRRVAEIVREANGFLLCDAVQAAGKIRLDVNEMDADFLVLSAHKIGGPQGVGALVVKDESIEVEPATKGGGQEKNRRAGTENVAAIAGFGEAAKEANNEVNEMDEMDGLNKKMKPMQDEIIKSVREAGGVVFGDNADRVHNTIMFALTEMDAQTAIIKFDLEGIAVSSGSACSSGKVEKSHVLKAMNVPDNLTKNAIRVSFGWKTQQDDIKKFVSTLKKITTKKNPKKPKNQKNQKKAA